MIEGELKKLTDTASKYSYYTSELARELEIRFITKRLNFFGTGLISHETEKLWKNMMPLISTSLDSEYCLGCDCHGENERERFRRIDQFFKKLGFYYFYILGEKLWDNPCSLYSAPFIDGLYRQLKGENVALLAFFRKNQAEILRKEKRLEKIKEEISGLEKQLREKRNELKKEFME